MEHIHLPDHLVIALAALEEKRVKLSESKGGLIANYLKAEQIDGEWALDTTGAYLIKVEKK